MFTPFLDSIFGFMLSWPPLAVTVAISFLMSLLIVVIYKLMTNQTEMKQLKSDLKDYQKQMKEHKNDTEKLMKLQKEAMSVNMKYMGKSMKPNLIAFIPIILIFGWMNAHLAYEPLPPGQEFALTATMEDAINSNVTLTVPEGLAIVGENTKEITDGTVDFTLKGEEGEYYATLEHGDSKVDKRILITTARDYAEVTETYKDSPFESVQLGNDKLRVLWKLTWIWTYIIFAILFSTVLRKLMKVH